MLITFCYEIHSMFKMQSFYSVAINKCGFVICIRVFEIDSLSCVMMLMRPKLFCVNGYFKKGCVFFFFSQRYFCCWFLYSFDYVFESQKLKKNIGKS